MVLCRRRRCRFSLELYSLKFSQNKKKPEIFHEKILAFVRALYKQHCEPSANIDADNDDREREFIWCIVYIYFTDYK